ncbi:hypothetical protein CLV24_109111 [Pontibacter ummariensis]|uniref:Uncharacterized protein n=1 Tax=Pontibacter ummariensis TaxID=1610492 RepID=A0A239FQV9_9BACT|nr:hypothetical protein CLV24_109111 [Pontibacter ummariensis]SNS58603.1 hypothetical protein SAMN06296052_10959 [Pontibacter ummariensis]
MTPAKRLGEQEEVWQAFILFASAGPAIATGYKWP